MTNKLSDQARIALAKAYATRGKHRGQLLAKCPRSDTLEAAAWQGAMRWHSRAKAQLRLLAAALGLEPGTYDVRHNYGGIAVTGESTLHGEHVYVQVSQPFLGNDRGVLYRRCNGRQDYSGGTNHFASLNGLNAIEALAAVIERDLGPCYKPNANEVR
jgi:hypothetical protein